MLKTLEEKEKVDWARHLPKLAFAYNVTVNKSTGYSPYFLMFGKEPRLGIDAVFGIENEQKIPKPMRHLQKIGRIQCSKHLRL